MYTQYILFYLLFVVILNNSQSLKLIFLIYNGMHVHACRSIVSAQLFVKKMTDFAFLWNRVSVVVV